MSSFFLFYLVWKSELGSPISRHPYRLIEISIDTMVIISLHTPPHEPMIASYMSHDGQQQPRYAALIFCALLDITPIVPDAAPVNDRMLIGPAHVSTVTAANAPTNITTQPRQRTHAQSLYLSIKIFLRIQILRLMHPLIAPSRTN